MSKKEDKPKKSRSPNFSVEEIQLLAELCSLPKHLKIIESKETNAFTWKEKEKRWSLIASEFNAMSGKTHRNADVLKSKFATMKATSRAKSGAVRRNFEKTGGGPPATPSLSSVDELALSMLGPSGMGETPIYDSDKVPPASTIPQQEEAAPERSPQKQQEETEKNLLEEANTPEIIGNDKLTLSAPRIPPFLNKNEAPKKSKWTPKAPRRRGIQEDAASKFIQSQRLRDDESAKKYALLERDIENKCLYRTVKMEMLKKKTEMEVKLMSLQCEEIQQRLRHAES